MTSKTIFNKRIEGPVDKIIQFICFDLAKLIKLFTLINENLKSLKNKSIGTITQPIRAAIWNWITNFPQEFINFCQENKPMTGNLLDLFDTILNWAGATKQKQEVAWPTLTILLLLVPDVFSDIIMDMKKSIKNEKWKKEQKYLANLVKSCSTKQKQLIDVSVLCFVDLYKASTYLNKNQYKALRFLLSMVQNDLQGKLISETPVKKSDENIDFTLMIDFLVSSYRITAVHVSSYLFPILFKGTQVQRLVLSKVLLQLSEEGSALEWYVHFNIKASEIGGRVLKVGKTTQIALSRALCGCWD
jgi:hypothetical protein